MMQDTRVTIHNQGDVDLDYISGFTTMNIALLHAIDPYSGKDFFVKLIGSTGTKK